jgi:hypothetical protein
LTETLITTDDLAKAIDRAIADLKDGTGSELGELASLCYSVSLVKEKSIYSLIPDIVYGLGQEITKFHSLTDMMGIMEEDKRKSLQGLLSDTTGKSIASLDVLKKELCLANPSPNYQTIVEHLSVLKVGSSKLFSKRSSLVMVHAPTPSGMEE